MQNVTPEKVWAAIEADESFMAQVPEGKPREVWRDYVGELLAAVEPRLGETVTLRSLIGVKVQCLKHAVESGFMRRLIESYPEDALGGMSPQELCDGMDQAMAGLVPMLEGIASDTPAWLAEQGVSEAQVMASPKLGLGAAALAKFRAGTLTIGELFCIKPVAIIKNTD
jgi:hypothetical protein